MKAEEFRKLSEKELLGRKKDLEIQLIKSKTFFGMELKRKKDHSNVKGSDIQKRLRKDIARINTILKERDDSRKQNT